MGADGGAAATVATLISILFTLNLLLLVFNLIPLPPLDGAGAVGLLLPERARAAAAHGVRAARVGLDRADRRPGSRSASSCRPCTAPRSGCSILLVGRRSERSERSRRDPSRAGVAGSLRSPPTRTRGRRTPARDRAARARAGSSCAGASAHAGSVAAASPVSANAWQRQPPKSRARSGQSRHGSGIHASPRNAFMPGASRPALGERALGDAPELEPGQLGGAVARQHAPVGRDDDALAPPAAHARLRAVAVIVGQHEQDLDAGGLAAQARHHLRGRVELRARGQQRRAVAQRPALVLRVRELEPLRAEPLRERGDLGDAARGCAGAARR